VQKLKDLFQYTWSKLMNDATLPLSRRKMRSPILPQNDAQGIQIQWKLDDRVSIGKPQIKATKDSLGRVGQPQPTKQLPTKASSYHVIDSECPRCFRINNTTATASSSFSIQVTTACAKR